MDLNQNDPVDTLLSWPQACRRACRIRPSYCFVADNKEKASADTRQREKVTIGPEDYQSKF